jgi:cytochrome c oxidase cbb3-type subunit 3
VRDSLEGKRRSSRAALLVLVCCLTASLGPADSIAVSHFAWGAQEKASRNPMAGNPAAVDQGKSSFRINCAACHGLDARGGAKGPDLTVGRWIHGGSDEEIFRTISQGVPGTAMPPNDLADEEIWTVVTYLRSLAPKAATTAAGVAQAGMKLFFGKSNCAQCHMVNGQGGRLGPDLSRVGAARSSRFLIDSIRDPDKDLTEGIQEPGRDFPQIYDTVTIVTNDGQRLVGVAKNEDNYSIQLMDPAEELHFLLKKDLKEVTHTRKSLMPAYTEKALTERELMDLLAYLQSLTGPAPR